MNIEQIKSPNFMTGRRGMTVDVIVLHSIVGTLEHAIREFKNTLRRASAHYGVDGTRIVQFVDEGNTAWHCGSLKLPGWNNNYHAIGIETAGGGSFGEATLETKQTTAELVLDIATRRGIPLDRNHVKEHFEMPGCSTSCASGLNADEIVSMALALKTQRETPPPAPEPPIPAQNQPQQPEKQLAVFPMAVRITTAASARVRSSKEFRPDNIKKLLAPKTVFNVYDREAGQVLDGNEVWLKTQSGLWVHASVTNFNSVLTNNNWR